MNVKENLLEEIKKEKASEQKLNKLREALHHLILQEADRKGAFEQISFLGGTALRIVYGLDRYSEDLDFSSSAKSQKKFDLGPLTKGIQKSLEAFGFECAVEKLNVEHSVHKCFFAFPNLLHDLDKTFRKGQKLAIKFDVDTNPPAGATETLSPITGKQLYKVRHYEPASLFAGKLHALLFRMYSKGRDLYDFLWYTGKKTEVNLTLLENAIAQSQKKPIQLNETLLREMLKKRFEETDFEKAKKDVAPFVENSDTLHLFEKEIFLNATQNLHATVKK